VHEDQSIDTALYHDANGGTWNNMLSGEAFDGESEDDRQNDLDPTEGGAEEAVRSFVEMSVKPSNRDPGIKKTVMPSSANEFTVPQGGKITPLPEARSEVTHAQLVEAGEVPFGWDEKKFRRRKKKVGNKMVLQEKFTCATGASVVPKDGVTGERTREYNGYGKAYYHYSSRLETGSNYTGASPLPLDPSVPFVPTPSPDVLDLEMMKELGLTVETMNDPLWFLFLVLPLVDIPLQGGRTLQGYFNKVLEFTNFYAVRPKESGGLGWGGATGARKWKNKSLDEVVRFFSILLHDGAIGGTIKIKVREEKKIKNEIIIFPTEKDRFSPYINMMKSSKQVYHNQGLTLDLNIFVPRLNDTIKSLP